MRVLLIEGAHLLVFRRPANDYKFNWNYKFALLLICKNFLNNFSVIILTFESTGDQWVSGEEVNWMWTGNIFPASLGNHQHS